MAENNDVNLNDIIKEQTVTIQTLVSELKGSLMTNGAQPQNPVYFTTPEATEKTAPNYVLYIGIGLAIWFFLKKR